MVGQSVVDNKVERLQKAKLCGSIKLASSARGPLAGLAGLSG